MNHRTNMDNFMFQFHGREYYHVKENYGLSSLQQARNNDFNDPTSRGRRLYGGGKSNMANYAGTCLAASMFLNKLKKNDQVWICVERRYFDTINNLIGEPSRTIGLGLVAESVKLIDTAMDESGRKIQVDRQMVSKVIDSMKSNSYPVTCLGPVDSAVAVQLNHRIPSLRIYRNPAQCKQNCRSVLINLNITIDSSSELPFRQGSAPQTSGLNLRFGLPLTPNTNENSIISRVVEIIRNGINNNDLEDVRGYEALSQFLGNAHTEITRRSRPQGPAEIDTISTMVGVGFKKDGTQIRMSNVDENSTSLNRNMKLNVIITTKPLSKDELRKRNLIATPGLAPGPSPSPGYTKYGEQWLSNALTYMTYNPEQASKVSSLMSTLTNEFVKSKFNKSNGFGTANIDFVRFLLANKNNSNVIQLIQFLQGVDPQGNIV